MVEVSLLNFSLNLSTNSAFVLCWYYGPISRVFKVFVLIIAVKNSQMVIVISVDICDTPELPNSLHLHRKGTQWINFNFLLWLGINIAIFRNRNSFGANYFTWKIIFINLVNFYTESSFLSVALNFFYNFIPFFKKFWSRLWNRIVVNLIWRHKFLNWHIHNLLRSSISFWSWWSFSFRFRIR